MKVQGGLRHAARSHRPHRRPPEQGAGAQARWRADPGLTRAALDAWSRDGELHGANLNGREGAASVQRVPGTDWLPRHGDVQGEVLEAPLASLLWQLVGLTLVLLLVFGALLIAMFNYLFAIWGRVSRALADIAHGEGIHGADRHPQPG